MGSKTGTEIDNILNTIKLDGSGEKYLTDSGQYRYATLPMIDGTIFSPEGGVLTQEQVTYLSDIFDNSNSIVLNFGLDLINFDISGGEHISLRGITPPLPPDGALGIMEITIDPVTYEYSVKIYPVTESGGETNYIPFLKNTNTGETIKRTQIANLSEDEIKYILDNDPGFYLIDDNESQKGTKKPYKGIAIIRHMSNAVCASDYFLRICDIYIYDYKVTLYSRRHLAQPDAQEVISYGMLRSNNQTIINSSNPSPILLSDISNDISIIVYADNLSITLITPPEPYNITFVSLSNPSQEKDVNISIPCPRATEGLPINNISVHMKQNDKFCFTVFPPNIIVRQYAHYASIV